MKKILLLLLFAVAFGFGQNADAFNDSRGITSDTESVEINEIDSVMYYNELVDRYESKAKREKIAYTALFSLGGAFFIGGTSLIVYDVAFRDYDKVDESSFPVGIMGYTLIVGSVAFIIGGVFFENYGKFAREKNSYVSGKVFGLCEKAFCLFDDCSDCGSCPWASWVSHHVELVMVQKCDKKRTL